MRRNGMKHQRDLHAYFVERVAQLAAERGLAIAGWQEMALDHSKAYNDAVRPSTIAVNCWTNAGDKGSRIAAEGWPLIISNVDYIYFDQTPNTHPEEPGLTWAALSMNSARFMPQSTPYALPTRPRRPMSPASLATCSQRPCVRVP